VTTGETDALLYLLEGVLFNIENGYTSMALDDLRVLVRALQQPDPQVTMLVPKSTVRLMVDSSFEEVL